jgi:uroporphyrinogen-III decarboxylase
MLPYGLPDVAAAQKALLEAGAEALKWGSITMAFDRDMAALGFPAFIGGGTKAPFDMIGDTLRGTRGIMLDIYRQPQKLLKALEIMIPKMIKMGVNASRANGNPVILIPLHKGADGFLSEEQFKTFYWPSLKNVILGLIGEGCIPFPWAEGSYNTRLGLIGGLPKGKVIWGFDATDMAKAKQFLGDQYCITGNVPLSLLKLAEPRDVENYVNKLIKDAGDNGGFILMNGAVIDEAKIENVKIMIDSTKKYGVYR